MSTAYSSAKQQYIGNGVTTEWGFDFPIKKHSELKVYLKRSGLQQVLLEEGVDYSFVTENTIAFPIKTGEAKLQATDVLALQRESVFESEYNFSNQQRLEPEEVMHADDNLERQIQELKRDVTQAIRIQPTSNIDTDEYFVAVESIYENLDNITNVSGISAEIVTCSNNIEAIQDAPNQANAAAQSASDAAQSASDAAQSASDAAQSATNAANSAIDSANSATASATSAQAAQDAADKVQGLIATPIGTIFQSIYVDESLDIARQLNGQLISSTKFTGFRSWLNTVQTATPNLFTTETNWQAEKTNSKLGQCGKFVVDDTAGTIRLPCVVNAQGLVDLSLIGGIKAESLPNITGTFGGSYYTGSGSSTNDTGAFQNTLTISSNRGGGNEHTSSTHSFDASRSSSTYQDNAPVQQEAVQYPYYIQVATGVEETLPAIREYNINTPFFFGQSMYSDVAPDNASWLASNGQWNAKTVYPDYYDWLVEQMNAGVSGFVASTATYTDYDFVINTTDQTFRLPLKNGQEGVFADGVKGNGVGLGLTESSINYGIIQGTIGSSQNYALVQCVSSYGENTGTKHPEGTHSGINGGVVGLTTDPSKSGMVVDKTVPSGWNLYYYVGDTVQDASLINAGAVLGQLANVNAASRGYVVESYHNGTEWYRIYSDGWIEQGGLGNAGGNIVHTLLKPFSNANYTITATPYVEGSSSNDTYAVTIKSKTTSSFTSYLNSVYLHFNWSACGY